ncbi:hypothetical protein Bbelb_204130 [Branchiostoma belcheri]|nr:hypothetical protein Bbelb_204130 [Branchiostoma belcheri]
MITVLVSAHAAGPSRPSISLHLRHEQTNPRIDPRRAETLVRLSRSIRLTSPPDLSQPARSLVSSLIVVGAERALSRPPHIGFPKPRNFTRDSRGNLGKDTSGSAIRDGLKAFIDFLSLTQEERKREDRI